MSAKAPGHVAITGGGGGIGAALAVAFSRRGARVALCGRDLAKLSRAAEACPGPATFAVCDVTRPEEVGQWLLALDAERPVDCIVANAGLGGGEALAGRFGESLETCRRILDVNVLGVVNSTLPLVGRMAERESGRIILVSSLAGLIALPDSPAYSASKAAVIAWGDAMRRLLKPHGVAVTVVCPGFVDTDMVRSLPMRPPFMWSPEKAAERIVEGALGGSSYIVFPWQLRAAIGLSHVLPRPSVDFILDRLRARNFAK